MKKFHGEMDVVTYFRNLLERATGSIFRTLKSAQGESSWATDGVLEWEAKTTVRVLLEAKFGTNLTSATVRSHVLAQALYYCKKFQMRGDDIPNVIFIADDSNCFAVDFASVQEFLDAEIDWSRAPSNPDPSLVIEPNVILEPTLSVDGEQLKALFEQLAQGCIQKVKPNKHNISAMFQYWQDHIFPKDTYGSVEMIDVFFGCLFYAETDEYFAYEHPTKKNTIVLNDKQYRLDVSAMKGFFERRERGLSAHEIDTLVSMRDRIIQDTTRRRQGAFYTPTLWVAEAHKELDLALGVDWRKECIVWDCCAGTGNLTRDYNFSDLILSTAEASDVSAIRRERYNEGADVFQYDFLNPETESPFFPSGENALPLSVRSKLTQASLSGKRLVFLINPPYATSGSKGIEGSNKAGVAHTSVRKKMSKLEMGQAQQQLFTQFMYQCEEFATQFGFQQKTVAIFSTSIFLASGSYKNFRSYWYDKYQYRSGFFFNASHFSDVSNSWGISFTLWNEGKTSQTGLSMSIRDTHECEVIETGSKMMCSPDDGTGSAWAKEVVPKTAVDAPQIKSALSFSDTGSGRLVPNALMYMKNNSNNVEKGQTLVYFTSTCASTSHGFSVMSGESWRRAIALFSARKLIQSTWITQKDEFLVPNTELPTYDMWVDDAHVYALLHSGNQTSSVRGVKYDGNTWDIHNHFFWLSRAEAMDLYGQHSASRSLFRDAKANPLLFNYNKELLDTEETWRVNGDPYFSYVLPNLNLSPLAREIMHDLNELFEASLPLRHSIDHVVEGSKSIDLHLHAWDAGIYQHKKLWAMDEGLSRRWKYIKERHARLGDVLRDGVYDYGFLKK